MNPRYRKTIVNLEQPMFPLLLFFASLVNDVRALIDRQDLAGAERLVRVQLQTAPTPETAAALSWVARGALNAKQWSHADKLAGETYGIAVNLLKTRKLDSDPWLPVALGAAIEVRSQALAAQGNRAEGVEFLRTQLAAYGGSSIHERIQKNLNLLSLEGQTAPALDLTEWLGPKPQALAALRGRPVLLFFWAHWCADCKGMAKAIASAAKEFGPRGLVVVAPTRRYGYVAGGLDAPPAAEKRYIEEVRRQYYADLSGIAAPLSAANFQRYGASSTPTVVLADAFGKVRFYHPGALTEPELIAQIRRVLAP
jgi:thiol-disulfide isomerase/thioredoxin